MSFAHIFNYGLSLGTVGAQVILILFIVVYIREARGIGKAGGKVDRAARCISCVREYALQIGFFVALFAAAGSLVYSEIIGFDPCELCWVQRAFLFPQIVILGIASWRNDRNAALYSGVLSCIGGAVALYHYYGQMFGPSLLTCSVNTGPFSSCAVRYFVQFGYMTIPMMSFTTFALLAVLAYATIDTGKNRS